jgi:hypothetical protein
MLLNQFQQKLDIDEDMDDDDMMMTILISQKLMMMTMTMMMTQMIPTFRMTKMTTTKTNQYKKELLIEFLFLLKDLHSFYSLKQCISK